MKLPSVKDLDVAKKKVLLRTNYDVPLKKLKTQNSKLKMVVADETRIEESLPTIKYLLDQKTQVIVISHLGRPGGKVVPRLSLKPAVEVLNYLLGVKKEIPLIQKLGGTRHAEFSSASVKIPKQVRNDERGVSPLMVLENLRFDPGEVANNQRFAQKLASSADYYINDAFAVSHRKHASIVGVPQFLPSAFGFDFLQEIKVLSKIRENPKRPVVIILGGVKKSKLEAAKKLINWADYILIGGRLVEYDGLSAILDQQKVLANLKKTEEDITMETVEKFKKIIAQAKTVVWSGPLGACQDEKTCRGTRLVAEALVRSGAYTVVGGGDTEAALTEFGLVDKINYISSGGGAMLAFLVDGTLPGIEAIKRSKDNKSIKTVKSKSN